ncbi:MAG: 4Fe-4S dicluster domain-containing protein [Thermodesulfobacteriota bacterium]
MKNCIPQVETPERATTPVRLLKLDPLKCDGCRECEVACSVRRSGLNDPALSSIRVASNNKIEGFHFPVVCLQCSDPPCMVVCPVEAICRDEHSRVMIRSAHCIGCGMCVAACPFGAMGFDDTLGRAFKCDLCGGEPECVRRCDRSALRFVEASEMAASFAQSAALKYSKAALGGIS